MCGSGAVRPQWMVSLPAVYYSGRVNSVVAAGRRAIVPRRAGVLVAAVLALVAFAVGVDLLASTHGLTKPWGQMGGLFVGRGWGGFAVVGAFAFMLVTLPLRTALRVAAAVATAEVLAQLAHLTLGTPVVTSTPTAWAFAGVSLWAVARWLTGSGPERMRMVLLSWAMIVAIPLSLTWLQVSIKANENVWDQYVELVDRALGSPSWVAARFHQNMPGFFDEIMGSVYAMLVGGVFLVALWQFRKGFPRHNLLQAFLLIGVVGPIFYVLFPVVGPVYAYSDLSERGFELANIWPDALPLSGIPESFAFDSATARNCMPSLHTAWTVLMFIHSRRDPYTGDRAPWYIRTFGAAWMLITLYTILAFGYHYAADILTGIALAVAVEALLREPARGLLDAGRVLVVGLASAVLGGLLLAYRFLAPEIAANAAVSGPLMVAAVAIVAWGLVVVYFPDSVWATPFTAFAGARLQMALTARVPAFPELPVASGAVVLREMVDPERLAVQSTLAVRRTADAVGDDGGRRQRERRHEQQHPAVRRSADPD